MNQLKRLLIFFIFVFSALTQAQDKSCEGISPDKFNVDSFIKRVKTDKKINNVESALCLIPKKVRSNFVLVHSSRSAQGSSPKAHRAIMFETEKNRGPYEMEYAISFNGDPSHTNYNNLEILKVNRHAKGNQQHFNYIDMNFKPENGKRVHVSHANPQECMMCHGVYNKRARAIWDAKGFFPTVAGRSSFGGDVARERAIKEFLELQKNAAQHPRYQFLEGFDKIEAVKSNVNSQKDVLKNLVKQNAIFGEALGTVNRRRIAQLMIESPNYKQYKYATLATLLSCGNTLSAVPKRLHAHHTQLKNVDKHFHDPEDEVSLKKGYDKYSKLFEDSPIEVRYPEEKMDDKLLPFHHDIEAKSVQWVTTSDRNFTELRWLYEGRGISMQEWGYG